MKSSSPIPTELEMDNEIDKNMLKVVRDKYKEQRKEKPPKIPFMKPDLSQYFCRVSVPEKEMTPEAYYLTETNGYSNVVFSTYPILNGKKFGKPIADKTTAYIFENLGIFCLADGCGMGERPATSAHVACESFSQYVVNKIGKLKSLAEMERLVYKGIAYAQTMILQSQDDPLDAGLTTFICAVVLKVEGKYAVIYANIGDCSGVVIDPNDYKISELVEEYARRIDVKITGGRLGPVDGEYPELDNLKVGIRFYDENTTILLMSDGICDNFDIKTFFESPKDCGVRGNEWHVANVEHKECRRNYQNTTVLGLYDKDTEKFCSNIYDHIVKQTTVTRRMKVNNEKGFEPGKMDHCCAAVIRLNNELFSQKNPTKKKMVLPDDLNI